MASTPPRHNRTLVVPPAPRKQRSSLSRAELLGIVGRELLFEPEETPEQAFYRLMKKWRCSNRLPPPPTPLRRW